MPIALHFDETYVWQRTDPVYKNGDVKIMGGAFNLNAEKDKTYIDENIEVEDSDLARLMLVVTAKRTDWWDVTPLTMLPVTYKFSLF